jgi:hypothetical protein
VLAQVDRIERSRARLIARLEALPRSVLETAPPSGGWSVLEIVEHLVLSEEAVLRDMDHPERLRPKRRSLRARLGFAAVIGVLSSPLRVQVPSSSMRPKGTRSFDELRAAWEESHRALRRHVVAVEEGRISGAVFRHPIAGPLTTRQAMRMLRVHLERHTRQIQRILREGE